MPFTDRWLLGEGKCNLLTLTTAQMEVKRNRAKQWCDCFPCPSLCVFVILPKWLSAGPALLQIAFLALPMLTHKETNMGIEGEEPMKQAKRLCALLLIKPNKCVSINLDLGGVKKRIRKKAK